MRVGLTYDLRDEHLARGLGEEEAAEFDRPETIDALAEAVSALGHTPVRIGSLHDLVPRLARGERWDLVFNIAEGLRGYAREAQVPALLEGWGIPFVFSDALTLAVALHKGMAKHVVRDAGLPTPDFTVVAEEADLARAATLPYPLFVKPVAEGTSKGIGTASRVESARALEEAVRRVWVRHAQPALVECFLPGREFTVGILGTGPYARVLGVMEVLLRDPRDGGIYGFETKEHYEERVRYRLVDDADATAAAEIALAVHRVLGCRDASRVDLRLDAEGRPCFLEINPLAGLHPTRSDLAILASLRGMGYRELIAEILASASARLGRHDLAAEA
ncbi:D-alanine--D-alanine ligase family protein [Inmirania thermothiophila]|uniref:D-alanine--D-alanine ligase n=1 Tax=Inmirania thermothiophila TaxID=1750597 RepID=A0A3N1Y9H1_9GAMM|nr:ATP-grasp domain-containing protein [Inmirania thermothiophila]ROR35191.1 D-alanine--D-alanine ligase [Inmirania thermothiophila]